MTLAGALYSLLSADATIAAAVGTDIYPVAPPQTALDDPDDKTPLIVYSLTGQVDAASHLPSSESGLWASTVEIYCLAPWPKYDTLFALGDAVRDALHKYAGTMGGVGGVAVQSSEMTDRGDDMHESGWLAQVLRFELVHG